MTALLDSSFFLNPAVGPAIHSLHLLGSDGRLEVLLAQDSLDLSQATISTGKAPTGQLTLTITQLSGHFAAARGFLGTYQMQVVDAQGHVVQGLRLRQPITIRYHYQPSEMTDLALDPGRLQLSWPDTPRRRPSVQTTYHSPGESLHQ